MLLSLRVIAIRRMQCVERHWCCYSSSSRLMGIGAIDRQPVYIRAEAQFARKPRPSRVPGHNSYGRGAESRAQWGVRG
jgi:hypothetical protein